MKLQVHSKGQTKRQEKMLILFFVRDEKVRQSCCVRNAALLATVLAKVGSIFLRSKPDCSTLTKGCHLVSKSETQWYAIRLSGTVQAGWL
ncbi:hypothetical protein NPIL_8791 [Nephila pilipes]|uniref:Uncharacterized protein n=1 Tax=Nephila pilipes TaxID=299642 RepID=A0A8X6TKN6_NEPPI|nr:hypothetical protein NPIL_8791 [Nephila pilipes]